MLTEKGFIAGLFYCNLQVIVFFLGRRSRSCMNSGIFYKMILKTSNPALTLMLSTEGALRQIHVVIVFPKVK